MEVHVEVCCGGACGGVLWHSVWRCAVEVCRGGACGGVLWQVVLTLDMTSLSHYAAGALQGLREVSTATAILTDPARVPQQVADMVAMATPHSQRPTNS